MSAGKIQRQIGLIILVHIDSEIDQDMTALMNLTVHGFVQARVDQVNAVHEMVIVPGVANEVMTKGASDQKEPDAGEPVDQIV